MAAGAPDHFFHVKSSCHVLSCHVVMVQVRQTILFHSLMREPGTLTRGRDTKGRIDALIEDLGLSQVTTQY